jgi:hypothetical protein
MNKKQLGTIIFLCFIIVFFIGGFVYKRSLPGFSEKRFDKVKIGWSKKQVDTLLGKPDQLVVGTRNKGNTYYNYYPYKGFYADTFLIVFDNKDIVIEKDVSGP